MSTSYILSGITIGIAFIIYFCWRFRPTVSAVATMLGNRPPPPPPMVQLRLWMPPDQNNQENVEPAKGLDQQIIDSYPRVVVGESGQGLKPDDDMCPVCLMEYLPNETLKIVPECLHRFHLDCLDEWLRSNPTCPVCRVQPSAYTISNAV